MHLLYKSDETKNVSPRLPQILEVANFFGIKGLVDLVCAQIARLIGFHFHSGEKSVKETCAIVVDSFKQEIADAAAAKKAEEAGRQRGTPDPKGLLEEDTE